MNDEPDEDDARVQADVLSFLIRRHPAHTSIDELHREMAEQTHGPYERDEVERATRDLLHVGLLHRHGSFVFATRAAVHATTLPH